MSYFGSPEAGIRLSLPSPEAPRRRPDASPPIYSFEKLAPEQSARASFSKRPVIIVIDRRSEKEAEKPAKPEQVNDTGKFIRAFRLVFLVGGFTLTGLALWQFVVAGIGASVLGSTLLITGSIATAGWLILAAVTARHNDKPRKSRTAVRRSREDEVERVTENDTRW